jgi:aspartate ammonia-lyase
MRLESDIIGELEISNDVLYGIHSLRAVENFPDKTPFAIEWYKAIGITKLACYNTYRAFKKAVSNIPSNEYLTIDLIEDNILDAMVKSAVEVYQGLHFDNLIVPAVQGSAGTSINMNINEIIANRSLQILGEHPGDYSVIDPLEHANVYQSTNDIIPTSLKITIMHLLNQLEEAINRHRKKIEEIENEHRDTLRIAYTQMQEAVPSSYGRLFSNYSEALSRDWWRVSKCSERIKIVNLGGGAIGTGLSIPRFFIMEVVQELQRLTGLPVTRGENLQDNTSNLDSLVEIHATIKAHAVNLHKIVSDLRLLSSDVVFSREIEIPAKQAGSSIMPGKVNPVISEFVISAAHKIYSNDVLVTSLCAEGCLDLNAYIPVIGHAIIESLNLLIAANKTIQDNMLNGLIIYKEVSERRLLKSPAVTTALNPYIGYHQASKLALEMKTSKSDVYEANRKLQLIEEQRLKQILEPHNLLKLGFSIHDISM